MATDRERWSVHRNRIRIILELDTTCLYNVKSNVIRAIVVRRRHRVRYYVIRDVFDIYKYFDAIDLRYYVREAIVI